MKCIATIACMFALLFSTAAFSQKGIGLKAGLNFVNVKNMKSISDANSGNKTGFHAGIFFAPKTSGLMGYRSEILFSRQGYDFKTTTATGDVMMDYILLPQLMTFNITKFVQLQVGGQMGILINAKADSVSSSSQPSTLNKAMDYYNKINYGVAGGVEVKPIAGLVIGGRYNAFFGSLNDQMSSGSTGMPSFIPSDGKKLKNGLVQLYVGYRF
jgi:hypothetical protein